MSVALLAIVEQACVRPSPAGTRVAGEECRLDRECSTGTCVVEGGRSDGTCAISCGRWDSAGGDCPEGFYCQPAIDAPMVCRRIGDGGMPEWLPDPR